MASSPSGVTPLPPLPVTDNAMVADATTPTTTTTIITPPVTTTTVKGATTTTTTTHHDDDVEGLRLKSIILVGGKGTRLRPLTYETPKQMLPLVGVPMIECVFEWLGRHDVTDAVLSLGYLPEQFTDAYPSNVIAGVRVDYAVEPEPLDTAGAIRFAATEFGFDETFLVVNGDVLTDLNITTLKAFHHATRGRGHDRAAPGR